MENIEKRTSKFWNYLGKISLFIGVIWIAIQIYSFVTNKEDYNLLASGQNFNFSLPSEYKKNLNIERINYEYRNLSRFYVFTIENTGKKPLEELVLEVPFYGLYEIVFPNDLKKHGSFQKRIEIGELRPSYEISVKCWTDSTWYSFYEKDSRVTHKYGWNKIKYPILAKGIYFYVVEYFALIVFMSVMAFLIAIFIVACYFDNIVKKEISKKTKDIEEQLVKQSKKKK